MADRALSITGVGYEKRVGSLLSLCTDVRGENNEIVSTLKVPVIFSESMLCLGRNRYDGDRETEGRTSWKPKVPFTAGSFGYTLGKTSSAAHTHCYMQTAGSSY